MHYFSLILVTVLAFFFGSVYSLHSAQSSGATDEEIKEADAILSSTDNVGNRAKVSVLFNVAAHLLREGKDEEALRYLSAGLKLNPWALDQQLVVARILAKKEAHDEAKEKATLVLDYAEDDALLKEASDLLKQPLDLKLPPLSAISGNDFAIVLVAMNQVDTWLLKHLEKEVAAKLKVPVFVQQSNFEMPPSARDPRKALADKLRANLKSLPPAALDQALKSQSLTKESLVDDKILFQFFGGLKEIKNDATAAKEFATLVEKVSSQQKQWFVDGLIAELEKATTPFKRAKVGFLGVTKQDICSPTTNFLFGMGGRGRGIMSYHRFTAAFNDSPPDRNRLAKRALMQALSSVGWLFGLERCADPRCARAYPHSLEEHDAKKGDLCSVCTKGFERAFERQAVTPAPTP